MSRPKQNLTPAQRKAYEARMRQLRQQQQRRGRAMPPPMTAAQKREIIRKQRLARRKAIQTQRQKVESAKTPLDRRQARTTLKAMQFEKKAQKANRKGNTEKLKKLATRYDRLVKRNQRLRNKQRQNEQNRLTKPKVSQQVRPTKATQKPLSPYKRKVAKPQRVTQPPPPRRVVRSQVRRRAPVVRARGRG